MLDFAKDDDYAWMTGETPPRNACHFPELVVFPPQQCVKAKSVRIEWKYGWILERATVGQWKTNDGSKQKKKRE